MVDKTLILRKLTELEAYLAQIREFSGISLDEYSRDWKTQRIVERTLQMMIETCADIANHIIADQRLRVPDSYADTFKVLGEAGILASDVSATMEDMARFRNIIVHGYGKVDQSVIVRLLHERLDDFLVFRDAIVRFLDQAGE